MARAERPATFGIAMIPARIIDRFPVGTRHRGADYYERGRVLLQPGGVGQVSATVAGTADYNVRIDTASKSWRFYCDCPAAFDRGLCKHMWATLLAADQARLLNNGEAEVEGGPTSAPTVPIWKRQLQQLRRWTPDAPGEPPELE